MSVYHKADPGELIQWVTHESWSSAASSSGLIRIGTKPRTADAWHQWLMTAARRRHPRFFGHFWPSVWPSSRSNFDLGPSPLDSTEKIFHIRAYDFGVQFSFNKTHTNTHAHSCMHTGKRQQTRHAHTHATASGRHFANLAASAHALQALGILCLHASKQLPFQAFTFGSNYCNFTNFRCGFIFGNFGGQWFHRN